MSERMLDGRVAVITGSARGIGLALALRLARDGADVVLNARSEERAAAALGEIRASGGRAEFVRADVRDPADVDRLFAVLRERYGRVDILVNNAGGEFRWAPFTDTRPEEWGHILDMYLVSRLRCIRAALEVMLAAGSGSVVNLVTDAGRLGAPLESVFAAAMGGTIAFTKSLAREVAERGVRVNCVAVTAVTGTRLYEHARGTEHGSRLVSAITRRTPLGLSTPEDVAEAVLYFASDRSRKVTGQVLSVNGGLSFPG